MAITVTATQGGSTAAGMALRVFVLTQAAATQNGATANNLFLGVTSFTLSITTTQTGSRVYGASAPTPSASMTAAALTTLVDNIADGTNNEQYVTFKATSLTGTPGATTLGFTAPSASSGPFAQAEIKTAGTLTEDASAPAVVSTTTLTAVTTASFTPPAGSLLVALVASDGGTGVTTMALSDTGAHTWTELVKNNVAGGDYAGVWIAQIPAGGATSGTTQPRATVPVPRRRLARALWAKITGQAYVQVPAPRQLPYLPPRRRPRKGLWWSGTGQAYVQVAAPPQGPPRPRSPAPRRAAWHGLAVPGAIPVPPRQPPYAPPRRRLARAAVQFTPVAAVNAAPSSPLSGTVQPESAIPALRRKLARAVVQFRPVATINAAPFVPGSGTVQPQATVPVPRRKPGKARWWSGRGQAYVQVPAPAQQPAPALRRKPGRALVQFTPVATVNAPPPLIVTYLSWRPRPAPRRSVWRGLAVPGITPVPPRQPPYAPPRRQLARALWRSITGQAYAAVAAPAQQPRPAPRRTPARAYVRFIPVPGTVPPFVTVPAPRQQPQPAARRKPARALVEFMPVATVNNPAPPSTLAISDEDAPWHIRSARGPWNG
jgi:hypothetical protein